MVPLGAPVTDWAGTSTTVANLGTGSVVTNSSWWRRVGDSMQIIMKVTKDGSGGSGSGVVTFTIPTGYSIDTTKLPSTGTQALGYAMDAAAGTVGSVIYNSATTVNIYAISAGIGNFLGSQFTANKQLSLNFTVPIVGWSSSTVVSSSADTRVVAASRNTLSSTTITLNTALNFTTLGYDTTGSFSSATTYTVPVPGLYRVTVTGISISPGTANLNVNVNGIGRALLTSLGIARNSGSATISVVAGDTVTISSDTSVTASSAAAIAVYIERISGPSQIAREETIACRVISTSSGISSTEATVVYTSKTFDTHSAYNTSTGVFTAPAPGYYEITANALSASHLSSTTGAIQIGFRKNGGSFQRMGWVTGNGATTNFVVGGTDGIDLNAGDTVEIRSISTPTTSFSNGNVFIRRL